MKKLVLISTLLLTSTLSPLTHAQVKKCSDANGKVTYTQATCPKATRKDQTLLAYTPTSSAKPNQGRDLYEESKAFNQRQEQRDYLSAVESHNRAAVDAFQKAIDKPLEPGQVRETRLTLTSPSMSPKPKK